jgi:hypothetical protein
VCRYADYLLCRQTALLCPSHSVQRDDVTNQHVSLIMLFLTLPPFRCNRGVSEAILRSVHPSRHMRPAQQRSHAQIRHSRGCVRHHKGCPHGKPGRGGMTDHYIACPILCPFKRSLSVLRSCQCPNPSDLLITSNNFFLNVYAHVHILFHLLAAIRHAVQQAHGRLPLLHHMWGPAVLRA